MGSRRATDCIAGDKPVDADSPAPGRRVRDLPTAGVPAAGASFLTGAGNRRWAFSLPGKTGAQRGHAPGKNRVRARLKCRHKHGARRSRATCPPQVCPPQARGCAGLFASQISFHLSLRPRRGFPCLSPPVALFPACGSCHLLLFHGPLRPLPVCLFCVVRTGFLSCFSLVFLPFPA